MTKLGKIFLDTGHIYISKKGYVSIEVYSSDRMTCDYVARMLGGVAKRHMRIRKVAIHNRLALVIAAQKLLEAVYDDHVEAMLRLVLEYAMSNSKERRNDAVNELRKLLLEEQHNDNHTNVKEPPN